MSEIKACLFDLDGVLVDTARYHYIAWRELAEELGFVFTEHDNERLKGVSRAASLNILLEIGGITLGEEEKARLAEQKNNRYVEYIAKMDSSEILPGALDFLKECREHGIKVALGSASKNAMTILDNTGLTPTSMRSLTARTPAQPNLIRRSSCWEQKQSTSLLNTV